MLQLCPCRSLQVPVPSHCWLFAPAEQVVPVLSSPLVTVTPQLPLAPQLRHCGQALRLQQWASTQLPVPH
jgi:hypothetical protein